MLDGVGYQFRDEVLGAVGGIRETPPGEGLPDPVA